MVGARATSLDSGMQEPGAASGGACSTLALGVAGALQPGARLVAIDVLVRRPGGSVVSPLAGYAYCFALYGSALCILGALENALCFILPSHMRETALGTHICKSISFTAGKRDAETKSWDGSQCVCGVSLLRSWLVCLYVIRLPLLRVRVHRVPGQLWDRMWQKLVGRPPLTCHRMHVHCHSRCRWQQGVERASAISDVSCWHSSEECHTGTRRAGGRQAAASAAGTRGAAADGRVQRFSDHEDSVYSEPCPAKQGAPCAMMICSVPCSYAAALLISPFSRSS